jgi:hypothetical protein
MGPTHPPPYYHPGAINAPMTSAPAAMPAMPMAGDTAKKTAPDTTKKAEDNQ